MREQVLFNARMQVAALRQLLRDRADQMSEDERNIILDQIGKLLKLIKELENER